MAKTCIEEAIALLEKSNADLEPELLGSEDAATLLEAYSRAQRLAGFGVAALTRKITDVTRVARVTGTSIGSAKDTVGTGNALATAPELEVAFRNGEVSLDQAREIAKAEHSAPGSAGELLKVAKEEPFHVLKEKARKVKLEAEQHRDLATRQREARSAYSHSDDLGMVHLRVALEPHVGTPIVARAEAEAQRLARAAKTAARSTGTSLVEPFDRYLADAFASLLSGSGKGRTTRPELVVLVSHGVAKRGWNDVKKSEICKVPGIGPVAPQVAREVSEDAFLSGVFYDGTDLRTLKRWTRHIPVEVKVALELGDPPQFDGVVCVDCGNRFRTEFDHLEPRAAQGPDIIEQPATALLALSSEEDCRGPQERKGQRSRPSTPSSTQRLAKPWQVAATRW